MRPRRGHRPDEPVPVQTQAEGCALLVARIFVALVLAAIVTYGGSWFLDWTEGWFR